MQRPFILGLIGLLAILSPAASGTPPEGDLPAALDHLVRQGVTVLSRFEAPGGLTGYGLRYAGETMLVYVTEDGDHLIVGQMMDAEGQNLSRRHAQQYVPRPDLDEAWAKLSQATWVAEGSPEPEHVVYTFTDPNCPYCHILWRITNHYHDAGLQVRHVLVAILKPSSEGKAAAILAADDPSAALDHHERNFESGGIRPMDQPPAGLRRPLAQNLTLMHELGISGTPAVVYRNDKGEVKIITGLVPPETLATELGLPQREIDDPVIENALRR